ncbi:hypothetical protein L5B83_03700 [Avibacterium sp. 21-599]|nr:hypothetical protein [Avibacterium sp. 21-599]MCW9717510.1 hypothetical protein [Avibacterium sp. 21-599]
MPHIRPDSASILVKWSIYVAVIAEQSGLLFYLMREKPLSFRIHKV